jgi:CDP-diacylglycerol pyrophosphatase
MTAGLRTVALVALSIALFASILVHNRQRDALRRIVQTQCLPHFHQRRDPAPCDRLILPTGAPEADGYAILHDIKGGVHELLIPIRTLAGIESPALLDPRAPDYVAEAWNNRDALNAYAGRSLTHDEVGLAINPQTARGQDQFHIHMACLGGPLRQVLARDGESIPLDWVPVRVGSQSYRARRISGATLDTARVISQVASAIPDGPRNLRSHSLVVAGHQFASGAGFVMLVASGAVPGEKLLDAHCTR